MLRKFTAAIAAAMLAFVTLAPSTADARDGRRGYYERHHGYHGRHHRRDNDGAAIAAGVIGLALGVALGAAASAPPRQRSCYDNYQRCAPPPPPPGYYNQGYYQGAYQQPPQPQPYYGGGDSAYERDYGYGPDAQGGYDPAYDQRQACTRQERQWDRYAQRYVTVDVPC
ncbi:MAG: hypothetical protein AB7P07_13995 [Hyphomonadaceae bacterium]